MTETDWKPGDVIGALLDGNEIVGIVRGGGQRVFYADSVTTDAVAIKHLRNVRRLLVIDPEDGEQIERLRTILHGGVDGSKAWKCGSVDSLTDALRAMLQPPKPPKPEEPLGLGAVVRDASQVEYVHLGSGLWAYGTTDGPSVGSTYADVDAVEVLSAGWTA